MAAGSASSGGDAGDDQDSVSLVTNKGTARLESIPPGSDDLTGTTQHLPHLTPRRPRLYRFER